MNRTEVLKANIAGVKAKVREAALNAKRNPDDFRIICVTKYARDEDVIGAVRLGMRDIGENRLQEAQRKFIFLKENLEEEIFEQLNWHLIGHLQTNKVKKSVSLFNLIQSVDSLRLAETISRQAQEQGISRVDVLLQVNISGESSKFGIAPAEAPGLLKPAAILPNLRVCGFMGIGPLADDPEAARPGFRELKRIYRQADEWLAENSLPRMSILSMGMTNDYSVAVEEGSNMIRVGTAIFGG